jgi:hypothetical protein
MSLQIMHKEIQSKLVLPNFFIVGAMKSGTSTLHDYLRDIEEIYMAEGEPHFFSDDDKFRQGLSWYSQLFTAGAACQAIGEKTATYSYLPVACERMHACLPQARLIWIFRDPVRRAYSHYWHSVKNGSERLSFAKAIAREERRVVKDVWRGYVKRSLYIEQVERFLQYYPKSQMLFLMFEEMLADPPAAVNQVLEFLDIPRTVPSVPAERQSNTTYIPRSRLLQWAAARLFGRGSRAYHFVKRRNMRSQPGYPPMSDELRRELTERFAAPNERLAELTGLDVGQWSK